ncbi:glutaredoxin [Actinotalea ferrariae]|uniref:glutaredoxin family protein n=1 Tax=Actinotalea ferrariae TaxID=1386098 RepID=UPI001C8B7687|nr:glutaredoxin family protein [Actinotalea ferrariae]MBX9243597.1 glutaredoxin [Actinotalea ferrariae]
MSPSDPVDPPVVTVVHAPACHFCHDAEEALAALTQEYSLVIRRVGIETMEGRALVAEHGPPMNPLVLVDGQFFSAGRLPRKKLAKVLQGRHAVAVGA